MGDKFRLKLNTGEKSIANNESPMDHYYGHSPTIGDTNEFPMYMNGIYVVLDHKPCHFVSNNSNVWSMEFMKQWHARVESWLC